MAYYCVHTCLLYTLIQLCLVCMLCLVQSFVQIYEISCLHFTLIPILMVSKIKKGANFLLFCVPICLHYFIKFLFFFLFFFLILSEIFYQICCRANYLQDMRGSTLKFLFKSMSYFLWIIMILEQEEALVDLVLFYDQTLCTLTVVVSY